VVRALSVSSEQPCKVVSRSWDIDIDALVSDAFIRGLEPSSELRLCVAWRGPRGFVPITVAPETRMPSLSAASAIEQRARTIDSARSTLATAFGSTASAEHPALKRFAAVATGTLSAGRPARTIAVLLGTGTGNDDIVGGEVGAALHATLLARPGSRGSSELYSGGA